MCLHQALMWVRCVGRGERGPRGWLTVSGSKRSGPGEMGVRSVYPPEGTDRMADLKLCKPEQKGGLEKDLPGRDGVLQNTFH